MSHAWESRYAGRTVLITGGLGFIGSNLAIRLVELGAKVTVVDNLLPEHGGNPFNVAPVADRIRVVHADIREAERTNELVADTDFVFHLAGQCDHVRSITEPYLDVDIRVRGTLVLLEACRYHSPAARLVYAGTRGEYGAVETLPVNEDAPTNPKGIYELTSLTAQHLFRIYAENHGLHAVGTRLTNVYGERSQMRHARFGVANWFIRLAIDNDTIKVFGTGTIKRDFLYIADCVDALAMLGVADDVAGQVFNVGDDTPSCFRELAETIVEQAGTGSIEMVPFTADRAAQEPGDYLSDLSKITAATGWRPRVSLADGVSRTIDYYRTHKDHYWQKD